MNREEAKALARKVHVLQVGDDGRPHFEHTARVAEGTERKLRLLPEGTLTPDEVESILVAAELHDCTEDFEHTGVTAAALQEMGCPPLALAIIANLNRPRGEDAPTYMRWIASLVDGPRDPIALWIGTVITKLADNEDNLSEERVSTLAPEKLSITGRWARSKRLLSEALIDAGYAIVLDNPLIVA